MNFYKRHIGDYLKDTAHLSLLEHGVYSRLMDVYYTREAAIPDSQAARLIGARSKDETQALQNVLEEFFTLEDGMWVQSRCEREIGAASDKADKNRENGKKGGRPRKIETEEEPTENPDGFQEKNHDGFELEPTNNLSQTPDSRLHKKPTRSSADDLAEPFRQFWQTYPRKVSKADAEKAYRKLKPDAELQATLLAAVALQAKSHDWQKDEGRFIPHAASWINGRRWEDQVAAANVHAMPDRFRGVK